MLDASKIAEPLFAFGRDAPRARYRLHPPEHCLALTARTLPAVAHHARPHRKGELPLPTDGPAWRLSPAPRCGRFRERPAHVRPPADQRQGTAPTPARRKISAGPGGSHVECNNHRRAQCFCICRATRSTSRITRSVFSP
jgi:hypothetical protein